MTQTKLDQLRTKIEACTLCQQHIPLGPRPVVRGKSSAKLLIIGQAPGTKVHETGIPWNDASGDRLRDWLGVEKKEFYDEDTLAIMPMGFCYPGRASNGGDNPPRPECAPAWHDQMLELLPNIQLTLLIGSYAQKRYLPNGGAKTMTQNVIDFQAYIEDGLLPLPHPSWRTVSWQRKNPFFDEAVLPLLKETMSQIIA